MTTAKDAAKRIKDKFAAKQVTLDHDEIERQIDQLVKGFGFSLQQAERAIFGKEARNRGVSFYEGKFSSADTLRDIGTIQQNEWVTVEGRVVSTTKPNTDKISIAGIIEDRTGAIRFVVWSRRKEGSPVLPSIVAGKSYRISSAIVKPDPNNVPSLNVNSNTEIQEIESDGEITPVITPINEMKQGVSTIRAKVIKLYSVSNDKVHQAGIVGDETGTVKFVAWSSEGIKTNVEEGKAYVFSHVILRDNKGMSQIEIGKGIKPLKEDITVKTGESMIVGSFVQVRQGSGLIKRCPVDGCGRVLSRQNFCPVHEIQDSFIYDIRIKGVIDDGKKAYNVIIPASETEKITGVTMKDAIHTAETIPMGLDDIIQKISNKVVGRYFTISGTEYPDRFFVNSITPVTLVKEEVSDIMKKVT